MNGAIAPNPESEEAPTRTGISLPYLCMFWPSVLLLPLAIALSSCTMKADQEQRENWKQEIRNTEHAFAEMVKAEGLQTAFMHFAADDAVLLRQQKLVSGRSGIEAFYEGQHTRSLSWEPDFIEVAASGDLGYTYGRYTYTSTDTTGQTHIQEGIFHTVWKRQPDGNWKYVWD